MLATETIEKLSRRHKPDSIAVLIACIMGSAAVQDSLECIYAKMNCDG